MQIYSGGQTGVDRAALDIALFLKLDLGGWCPKKRIAEDGRISSKYPLKETVSSEYAERTKLNVQDSDATLILFYHSIHSKGAEFTIECAKQFHKPFHICKINDVFALEHCLTWVKHTHPSILNIAGPRESEDPGIYSAAYDFLLGLLSSDLS